MVNDIKIVDLTDSTILKHSFNLLLVEIGKYLEQAILEKNLIIKYQEKNDETKIADLGRAFGVIYDSDGNLILAKWLLDLSENVRNILVNFILTREAFRLYVEQILYSEHQYKRFTEILLQIITILWIIENKKYRLTSYHTSVIRQRTDAYVEEEQILKSDSWVYFLTNCIQVNITAKKLFPMFIECTKAAIEENKTIIDLAWDLMYWLKAHLPEELSYALPYYVKKKDFQLLKALGECKYADASALNLSKVLGKSHNSINVNFKLLMDKHGIFWWPNIHILKLKLYPYFLRVHTNKKEHHEILIEKFKALRYFKFIRESITEDVHIIVGWLESPLIIYEHLLDYLEKSVRNNWVSDYSFKQIRQKKITWTVTTQKYKPTKETYNHLFNAPRNSQSATLQALMEEYEIVATPIAKKKEIFNEDVLTFLSTLHCHHLGKSDIRFRPIELIYELCQKKNIPSENSPELLDFVNQMEIRCRRLGAFDYYLYFREFNLFKKALYFELLGEYEKGEIYEILEMLQITGEMITVTLIDRVVIIFPDVKFDSLFREILEELLNERNIQYYSFQINFHRGLKMQKFLYNEAFDFQNDCWKKNF